MSGSNPTLIRSVTGTAGHTAERCGRRLFRRGRARGSTRKARRRATTANMGLSPTIRRQRCAGAGELLWVTRCGVGGGRRTRRRRARRALMLLALAGRRRRGAARRACRRHRDVTSPGDRAACHADGSGRRAAAGRHEVTIPTIDRADEIGSMAGSLQVFKDALVAKKAADKAAAAEADAKIKRGHRVDQITRDFETMVGEIVNIVSSASTELEASAGTLTASCGAFGGAGDHGGRRFRRSLDQRAIGGVGDGGDGVLGQRDQPAGPGIPRGSPLRRWSRRRTPMIASASCRTRRPGSATWSS